MNFLNVKCPNSYCSLFIDAVHGYQVNLTVITSRLCDTSCTYNGLVYGEKLVDDYRHPDTLCEHHVEIKVQAGVIIFIIPHQY